MERLIQSTTDGSHTIAIPEMNVTYHSKHGAIQESMHVFIDAGWRAISHNKQQQVNLLEMGFGTGLNALLTLKEAGDQLVFYESLEAFPVTHEMAAQLNYPTLLNEPELEPKFQTMHTCEWDQAVNINDTFILSKRKTRLQDFQSDKLYHLVYFDAFAPNAQPELWTSEVFSKLYSMMHPGAILVTYCSKGDVRRAMLASGLEVEKIPGPPGKREMLRAVKLTRPSQIG